MKFLTRSAAALLFAMTLIVSFLSPVSIASATSDFDEVINPVEELVVVNFNNPSSCTKDLTTTWAIELDSLLSGDLKASFANRAAWSVGSVYDETSAGLQPVTALVYWWEQSELPLTASFTTDNSANLSVSTFRYAYMGVNNQCNLTAYTGGGFSPTIQPAAIARSEVGGMFLITRPFGIHGISVDYPVGYEGEQMPTAVGTPAFPSYVAMGDSFSSGEGVPSYVPSTDVSGVNQCHQSLSAYPYKFAIEANLGIAKNVTCSGATIDDVKEGTGTNTGAGSWSQPKQITQLSDTTTTVTISIGGNDAGFGEVLTTCMKTHPKPIDADPSLSQIGYDRQVCLDKINQVKNDLTNGGALKSELSGLYEDILDASAVNSELYVIGYPHIFTEPSNYVAACEWGNSFADLTGLGLSERYVSTQENQGMRDVHDLLISLLSDAVADVEQLDAYEGRIQFVDVTSSFDGHEVCSNDEYLHHIYYQDLGDAMVSSFHPNQKGQDAYKQALIDAMS